MRYAGRQRSSILRGLLLAAVALAVLAGHSASQIPAAGQNQADLDWIKHRDTVGTPDYARIAEQLHQLSLAQRSRSAPAAASTPAWTFIGPEPILNAAPNFGGSLFTPTPAVAAPTPTPSVIGVLPGSYNATGRVTSVAVLASTIFVGTANGGLWKGAVGSSIFQPVTGLPAQAIGAIGVNSVGSPPVVYVATGEANNGADSYYGSGIFRSSDLGSTWSLSACNYSFLKAAFTRMAVVPNAVSSPTIFAAAGLGFTAGRGDPDFQKTNASLTSGLFRSDDGGCKWFQYSVQAFGIPKPTPMPTPTPMTPTTTPTPKPQTIACSLPGAVNEPCPADDVVVDPYNPNFVYTAIETDDVFASSDGGGTWTAACFTNDAATNCTFPHKLNQIGRPSLAVGPPAAPLSCPVGMAMQTCGTVYAMLGAPDGVEYLGLYKSLNGGATWAAPVAAPSFLNHNSGVTIDGSSSGNLSLSANDQVLFADGSGNLLFGGVGIYGSTSGGASWLPLFAQQGGTHSGQHAIAEDSSNNVYIGNNGGIFSFPLPLSPSPAFNSLNGTIGAGQIQSIAPDPVNNDKVLAGFQDNGVQMFNLTSLPALPLPPNVSLPPSSLGWNSVETGNAGITLIDHSNSSLAYHTFATTNFGPSLSRSSDGGFTWDSRDPTISIEGTLGAFHDLGANVYPALASDPSTAGRVLFGAHSIYVSTNGMLSWQQQESADLTGGCRDGTCGLQDIEIARSDNTRGWALSISSNSNELADGPVPNPYTAVYSLPYTTPFANAFQIFNTTQANLNSGAVWTNVTQNFTANVRFFLSSLQATGIAIDPNHATNAYISLSGSRAANGVGHVYRTTDFGASWAMLDGPLLGSTSLPDVPVLKVLVERSDITGATLYAGTDSGVYRTTDAALTWAPFNGSTLPASPIFDMAENDNNLIFLGTHGRGAYAMQAPAPGPVSLTVTPVTDSFGNELVFGSNGQAAIPKVITVTNPKNSSQQRPVLLTNAPMIIGAPDFTVISTTCTAGLLLAPNAQCTVKVGFQPTAAGVRTATLTLVNSASNSPQSVGLNGTGVAAKVSINPTTINFGAWVVNSADPRPSSVTAANNNPISMMIQNINLTGANPGDYSFTAKCGPTFPATLGSNKNCTVSVTFKPTAKGARTANLQFTDNAAASPQTVNLTGTGK
jgi:hypothetical protein